MFNLRFSSETNNPALLVASTEYQSIWKKDGQKIKEIMEKISGLSFPKKRNLGDCF